MKNHLSRLGEFEGSFTNVSGHSVEGAGLIFGVFTNESSAYVLANHPTDSLTVIAPGDKTNKGILGATNGGRLRIETLLTQTSSGMIHATGGGTVEILAEVDGCGRVVADVGTVRLTPDGGCASLKGNTLEILGDGDGNPGFVEVSENASIDLSGAVTIGPAGTYQRDSDAPPGSVMASLVAGSLTIAPGNSPVDDAGAVILEDAMSMTIAGDVLLDGTLALPCNWCDRASSSTRGGLTPPIKHASHLAAVSIAGDLDLFGSVDLAYTSLNSLELGGDFGNCLGGSPYTYEDIAGCFDWSDGGLLMNGSTEQIFEVAGRDFGPSPAGFQANFAMGTVEISSGSHVRFVDSFDNDGSSQAGPHGDFDDDGHVDLEDYAYFEVCHSLSGPNDDLASQLCTDTFDHDRDGDVDLADVAWFQRKFLETEVLYVRTLIFGEDSSITVDDCRVYYESLIDEGANIIEAGYGRLVHVP